MTYDGVMEAMGHGLRRLRLVAVGLIVACAGPQGSTGSTGSSDGGSLESGHGSGLDSSGAGSGSAPVPAPPVVVDIGQDAPVLREGESMVLTAVVFDSDDDVVGGELFGPGQPSSYGPFTAHPSDRWRVTVRWADVHERSPLHFSQEQALPFWARFVDAAGHEVVDTITLRAVCGGLRDTACDGECVDVQVDDQHCDGCGRACAVGPALRGVQQSGGCEGSTCQPWWSECMRVDSPPGPQTCAQRCAAAGATCVDFGCSIGFSRASVMAYDQLDPCLQAEGGAASPLGCDEALVTAPVVRCCCR